MEVSEEPRQPLDNFIPEEENECPEHDEEVVPAREGDATTLEEDEEEREDELVRMEDVMDEIKSDEDAVNDSLEKTGWECQYCNYSSNRRSELNRHVRVHTGENLHCCVKCDYKTTRKSDLRRHHLLHVGEKPFKCGVCNYTTSRKAVLLKHMRIHTANLPRSRVILVQVTKDGQKVINDNALGSAPTPSTSGPTGNAVVEKVTKGKAAIISSKTYQCDQCDFVVTCRKTFHEHRLSHGKEQKWKCPTCGYVTIRKSDMTRHYNMHIDNVFKCTLCDYKTVRQSDFIRHSKTHNKNK